MITAIIVDDEIKSAELSEIKLKRFCPQITVQSVFTKSEDALAWLTDNRVDVAFLDATFYSPEEMNSRSVSEIPHPFVEETLELFKNESKETKRKIHFIHLNHSNPLLWDDEKKKETIEKGFNISKQGERY